MFNRLIPKKILNFDKKDVGGFTLIEILVVISIMSVVFGIVITAAARAQKNARDAQKRSDLAKVQLALEQFYADQGHYPVGIHMDRENVLDSCMDWVAFYPDISGLTACRANPARKIYLKDLPHSLDEQRARAAMNFGLADSVHYCYRAQVSRSDTTTCDFDDITPANTECNYYQLYARLETGPQPYTSICIPGFTHGLSHEENYVVTPDTTGRTF